MHLLLKHQIRLRHPKRSADCWKIRAMFDFCFMQNTQYTFYFIKGQKSVMLKCLQKDNNYLLTIKAYMPLNTIQVQLTCAFRCNGIWPRSVNHWPSSVWPNQELVKEVQVEGFDLLSKEVFPSTSSLSQQSQSNNGKSIPSAGYK